MKDEDFKIDIGTNEDGLYIIHKGKKLAYIERDDDSCVAVTKLLDALQIPYEVTDR